MLVDMRTFQPMAEALIEHGYRFRGSQAPRTIEAGKVLHCPLCKREMKTRHRPGGVMIDMTNCSRCLMLWLDHVELGRIAAA
jgi:hypothetical protein